MARRNTLEPKTLTESRRAMLPAVPVEPDDTAEARIAAAKRRVAAAELHCTAHVDYAPETKVGTP